jgi:L-alanine-DL-glutamate epimerase-like enolase superfamily enzyme
MRIIDICERTVPISRYADPALPSGGLTTSIVAVVTDMQRDGQPVIGYGFSSFGRYGQGGLIRDRFASRLLQASAAELSIPDGGNLDPARAWAVMMQGEKPGGHGERCVAIGTLDMAIWDAAAKIAGQPLHFFLAAHTGRTLPDHPQVPAYASGGYLYPAEDLLHLADEMRGFLDQGYHQLKIKIGATSQAQDLRRIETVMNLLPAPDRLAIDAMNVYGHEDALRMAAVLAPVGLRWFEDLCDPLDFDTLAHVAGSYAPPLATGEALFSLAEARLLQHHGGLRPDRDILLFDPVHCYGLTHYLDIVAAFEKAGWPRSAFWPHGGHLFAAQIAAALGLGGAEVNPCAFQPFGGLGDDGRLADGSIVLSERPGIGLEAKSALMDLISGAVST